MEKYGLERIRLHDMRHTAGTLLSAKATMKQVQEFLGHEDISTTANTYVHLLDEDLGIERIGQIAKEVCQAAGELVCESSYRAAAKAITENSGLSISPQGVWNIVQKLGEMQIDSVLVEGGGTLHGSLLLTGLVNRVYAYVAPKLIGGREAKSPVEGAGFARMREAEVLEEIEIISFGEDI